MRSKIFLGIVYEGSYPEGHIVFGTLVEDRPVD